MRTIAIALLLVAAAAVSAEEDIDRALRNMFEFRIAEMDDPTRMDEMDVVDLEIFGLMTLDGILKGVEVAGIHNVRLQTVKFNANTLECELDITMPKISVKGQNYDLRGHWGGIIPVFGNGPFTAEADNIRVKGTARLAVTNDGFVSLASFRSVTTISSVVLNFQNLLLGGEFGDLMNYIMGDMVPFILRNQQSEVSAMVEERVIEMANEEWKGKTLEELLMEIMEFL